MIEKELAVRTEEGLHTRPANQFVKLAKGFESTIEIVKGDKTATGTSLLKIMKLGVVQGDEIVVRCEGPDEAAAMAAIEGFLS
jgi:phosphotransferase system HPr (HPr) family protein